jgi:hypothetical protein
MLDLHITGTDLESFRAKLMSILGLPPLDNQTSDEDLLVELRQRYAKRGMVIKLAAFDAK